MADRSMDVNISGATTSGVTASGVTASGVTASGVTTFWSDGCCGPVTAAVLDEDAAAEVAAAFKALADPARLRLLSLVAASETGEACACDLVTPIGRAQPTVSHHLSVLVDAGLLAREKRGKWAWYRVVPERLAMLRDVLGPVPG